MISLSDRVPGRASGPLQSCVDDGGGLQYVSWKLDRVFRFFPSRGIYRRKDGVRKWTRRVASWWRGQGLARAALGCGQVLAPPSVSALDSDSCSGKIGGSAFVSSNSENISYVAFLKHKNSRKQRTGTVASH
jgi:hypothetical protein